MGRRAVVVVAAVFATTVACAAILDLPPLELIGDGPGLPDASRDSPSSDSSCVPSCKTGSCGSDGCGGTCACTTGNGCVQGACFPCTESWKTKNVFGFALAYDAKRNFVVASAPVDGGAALTTLNACTGGPVEGRPLAPSTAGIDPVPDFHELVVGGDFLYSRGGCTVGSTPPDMCVYRYDVAKNVVDARGSIAVTNVQDEIWNLAATASGKVFASGTFGGPKVARVAALEPGGANCGGAPVDAGAAGYAIGASGDDVYQMIATGVPGQLVLAHFVASACATGGSPCACAPSSITPPLMLPTPAATSNPKTFSLLVRGKLVYVVGLYPIAAGGAAGFVVAFDLAQNVWSPPFVYAPSGGAKTDGLVYATITPDEKLLYVVGAKDAFTPTSTGVLLRFDLPLSFAATPKANGEIEVPGAQVVWQAAVTADAVFVAADSSAGAFVARCTTSLSCPK